MFGIRNKTATFFGRVGSFSVDLVFGFIEEVTFNVGLLTALSVYICWLILVVLFIIHIDN